MKAIFLGKFQPPHLGHVRTILKIATEYSSVIIGITKGPTKAVGYEEVKGIFDEVFKFNENITTMLIDGTIEDSTASLDDLDFDVIISGNQKVLSLLSAAGYQTKFQPRSEGFGHSSSELRAISSSHNSISVRKSNLDLDVALVPTGSLKPLEKVMPSHLINIEKMILADQVMKKPIIVDDKYSIVLDGSHRYAFLVKYGYKYAPVVKVDYSDEAIFVGNHLKHRFLKDDRLLISKSEVVSRGVNEQLFDARTTRHFFPFRKRDYPTPLNVLEAGEETDISYLVQSLSLAEEIAEDLGYIEEINEELTVLNSYIQEQIEVKNYLNIQIEAMKKALDH
jgi:hypothetical protein